MVQSNFRNPLRLIANQMANFDPFRHGYLCRQTTSENSESARLQSVAAIFNYKEFLFVFDDFSSCTGSSRSTNAAWSAGYREEFWQLSVLHVLVAG
jgi:hypothetical protein